MNLNYNLITLGIILIILSIGIIYYSKKSNNDDDIYYKSKDFMSDNEKKCFHHLLSIYPEYYIVPQVSMGAILEPTYKRGQKNREGKEIYQILFNKISSKRVDFTLIDKNLNIVLIIELDDNSHNNKIEEDKIRDKHLNLAGIPTIRFRNVKGSFPSRTELDKKVLIK